MYEGVARVSQRKGVDATCERSPVRRRVCEGKKSETRRPRQSFDVTWVEMSQNRSIPEVFAPQGLHGFVDEWDWGPSKLVMPVASRTSG